MILSAQSIRARCLEWTPPLLVPFVERSVSPGGRSFGLSAASYDVRIDQDVIIPPHGFVRASTVEHFNMHDDLAGGVRDKSSWARLGLAVQNTHLDPGWPGYLTLELTNHSDAEIRVARGEPIAQIVFELLDQATELPYRGKYYDQERGPQPARYEREMQAAGMIERTVVDLLEQPVDLEVGYDHVVETLIARLLDWLNQQPGDVNERLAKALADWRDWWVERHPPRSDAAQ
jgi:dCTP deaminase